MSLCLDAMLASVYASLSFFGGMLLTVCILAVTKFIEYRLHGYRMPWTQHSASMDRLPKSTTGLKPPADGHSEGDKRGHSVGLSKRHGHRAGQYRLGPCVIEKLDQ